MMVQHLAVQTGNAFVWIDMPFRMDSADWAFVVAAHTRIAALTVTLKPVEHPQATRDRKCRAERTQVAAEEPLDEQANSKERKREDDKPPVAHET